MTSPTRRMGTTWSPELNSPTTPSPLPSPPPVTSTVAQLRPGIAAVVGILTCVFSLTFVLLLYAKHCKRTNSNINPRRSPAPEAGRPSGVDRTTVESLPVFRFGALEGLKDGLDCAVCLGRFETEELLRLLPKCNHAFHIECVDTWLDAHSTCPLCRCHVDPEDVFLISDLKITQANNFKLSYENQQDENDDDKDRIIRTSCGGFLGGVRVSGRHSSAGEQRSGLHHSRANSNASSRKSLDEVVLRGGEVGPRRKDLSLMSTMEEEDEETKTKTKTKTKRFDHRIVVGSGERWSDLRPSDLLFLRAEMIVLDSGVRTSCSSNSARGIIGNPRSNSEITGVSREGRRNVAGGGRRAAEERDLRRWLRRWFGSRGVTNNNVPDRSS